MAFSNWYQELFYIAAQIFYAIKRVSERFCCESKPQATTNDQGEKSTATVTLCWPLFEAFMKIDFPSFVTLIWSLAFAASFQHAVRLSQKFNQNWDENWKIKNQIHPIYDRLQVISPRKGIKERQSLLSIHCDIIDSTIIYCCHNRPAVMKSNQEHLWAAIFAEISSLKFNYAHE